MSSIINNIPLYIQKHTKTFKNSTFLSKNKKETVIFLIRNFYFLKIVLRKLRIISTHGHVSINSKKTSRSRSWLLLSNLDIL